MTSFNRSDFPLYLQQKMAPKVNSENGWQDSKPNVHARISHLLQNDFMSDFTFVSEGVQFPVHKFVLAATSSVFYPMFYGPMAEQKQELDLSSFGNAECISQFLKFVYTDKASLNWRNVFQLLNLAKCYLISSLQKKCTEFIKQSVTTDNVLSSLQHSLFFDANAAVNKCLEIIRKNASHIVQQDSFLALNLASLKAILQLDTLDIEEKDLILAVNRWCESKLIKEGKEVSPELKRKVLGDAVYLIRFLSMDLKDFEEHYSNSGLLTPEQVADILHYISLDGQDLQETLVDKIGFCTKPRKRGKEIVVNRILPLEIICKSWQDSHQIPNTIGFTVNKRAYLKGISLFSKIRPGSEMTITTHAGTFKPTYTMKQEAETEEDLRPLPESFRVSFKKPIEILANQKVNVCVVMDGKSQYIEGDEKETFENDGFQCQFFAASNSDCRTNVNQGQFPAFIFEV